MRFFKLFLWFISKKRVNLFVLLFLRVIITSKSGFIISKNDKLILILQLN